MLLRRVAPFLDLATIWRKLEAQPQASETDELAESHIGTYGPAELYLGIVRATGERALWMITSIHEPALPADLPAAMWVKKITYPDYALLTVVLAESEQQEAFDSFAYSLLGALEQANGHSAVTLLVAQLRQWQPAHPLQMAA